MPYERLHAAGHQVEILGLERGKSVEGKKHEERIKVERAVSEVSARDYDALVIPGGYSPDRLRVNADAVRFTKEMAEREKPIAAVCHAPAVFRHPKGTNGKSVVDGKKVTGFTNSEEKAVGLTDVVPFLVEDMLKKNGGNYSKGPDFKPYVLKDGLLISGQNPASSEPAAKELLAHLN